MTNLREPYEIYLYLIDLSRLKRVIISGISHRTLYTPDQE